ncbi:MAG: RNA polymerase sigma factor [Chloroflexi bacterium]|nr:RNA polymerase sigma factor [Chloroflexota bacterium]MCI0575674.1 RNA polymerase sigma factor [Chloroflexota bacterium]MCI0647523.1 RNA polymerase sigma factor [Chloroflexota bacterium]MCI0730834.1 RNA polymerase sigma factor [Chloroflexota bacterium]
MTEESDSAELYLACQSSDAQRQAAAYQVLWRYLFRVALHVVRDQPEAEALAQDCAQNALIRIHQRLAECREPAAFRAWARRITSHIAIDELRARKRLLPLPDDETTGQPEQFAGANPPAAEMEVAGFRRLYEVINQAPISGRSRRVILGRYLEEAPDEQLARRESEIAGLAVLPSHIQVTRAKNIAKLRAYEPIRSFLDALE